MGVIGTILLAICAFYSLYKIGSWYKKLRKYPNPFKDKDFTWPQKFDRAITPRSKRARVKYIGCTAKQTKPTLPEVTIKKPRGKPYQDSFLHRNSTYRGEIPKKSPSITPKSSISSSSSKSLALFPQSGSTPSLASTRSSLSLPESSINKINDVAQSLTNSILQWNIESNTKLF
uniref:Uncharacterized protein LOC113791251 n=1 Tax=Dermatophagoides pteronyssinus TaxID=6956 RepID=A0A6P6XV17_DERPT|nr:uncharacterized protein LOC113791251 [Dermatophagoides pteronyssinus]